MYRETEIYRLPIKLKRHHAGLHINHRPYGGEEWLPQNNRDLGAILQIQHHKIKGDEELAHLNRNILYNTHTLLDGAICQLNRNSGGCQVHPLQLVAE